MEQSTVESHSQWHSRTYGAVNCRVPLAEVQSGGRAKRTKAAGGGSYDPDVVFGK